MVLLEMINRCHSNWKELNEVGNFSTFRTHARVNLDMTFHKIDLNPEATKISHENVWDAKKIFGVRTVNLNWLYFSDNNYGSWVAHS